jgi:MSHA pilin protein MshA
MSRSAQRGFTRLELVVVIVILGILAAVALPKVMGVDTQARIAALDGMTRSLRSAANMAHGVWLANSNTTPISVDGTTVNIVFGYPDSRGIQALIQDQTGFTVTVSGATTTFAPSGARNRAKCNVVYEQAPNASSPFTLTLQSNTKLQNNC